MGNGADSGRAKLFPIPYEVRLVPCVADPNLSAHARLSLVVAQRPSVPCAQKGASRGSHSSLCIGSGNIAVCWSRKLGVLSKPYAVSRSALHGKVPPTGKQHQPVSNTVD